MSTFKITFKSQGDLTEILIQARSARSAWHVVRDHFPNAALIHAWKE